MNSGVPVIFAAFEVQNNTSPLALRSLQSSLQMKQGINVKNVKVQGKNYPNR